MMTPMDLTFFVQHKYGVMELKGSESVVIYVDFSNGWLILVQHPWSEALLLYRMFHLVIPSCYIYLYRMAQYNFALQWLEIL